MSRRILLADDSVTIQKVIELTFMDEDFEVKAVSNGDEAVAALPEVKPDFVIADVHMPGANGYAVCRQAKQLYPRVPVLLLVGTFEPFDEAQARECGADSFLKKPFDSQELLQRVQELLAANVANIAGGSPAAAATASAAAADEPAPAALATERADFEFPPLDLDPPPAAREPAAEPEWSTFELEPDPLAPSPFTAAADTELPPLATDHAFVVEDHQAFVLEEEPPLALMEDEEEPAVLEPQDRFLDDAEEPAVERPAPARPAGFAPWSPEPEESLGVPLGGAPLVGSLEEAEERIASPAPPATEPVAAHEPASPAAGATVAAPVAATNGGGLSGDDVERIARRVVELLADKVVRDLAWEVIPDMAEVVIRERLRELESQVE
jgi:CheY-like chemotaxis protein